MHTMNQTQSTGLFSAMSITIQNLFGSVNTAANLINRSVNSLDNVMQVGERTAVMFNRKHEIVSLKEMEQIEEQYKLLTPEQKALEAAF